MENLHPVDNSVVKAGENRNSSETSGQGDGKRYDPDQGRWSRAEERGTYQLKKVIERIERNEPPLDF